MLRQLWSAPAMWPREERLPHDPLSHKEAKLGRDRTGL